MIQPLKTTIQSIEDSIVKLTLEDGQTLRIPVSACEGAPKTGLDAYLLVAVPGAEDAARQALAQHILNQLLGMK